MTYLLGSQEINLKIDQLSFVGAGLRARPWAATEGCPYNSRPILNLSCIPGFLIMKTFINMPRVRRCEKIEYNHFSVDRRDIPVPPMKVWQDKNVLPIGLKPIFSQLLNGDWTRG